MATKIVTKNSSTASAVPTASDLVQGELAVNVADKRLFTEDNAGAIVELGTNPSGNVTFQDNGKAIFGAGSDLQIYHNATSNIIDSSAATLAIQAPQFVVQDATGAKNMVWVPQNGGAYEVQLSHDGSTKLATTATGIQVTGDVDTSGLLKVGTNDTEYANNYIRFKPTGAAYIDHNTVGQAINFRLSNASSLDKTAMTITSAGNVGIGVSPSYALDVSTVGHNSTGELLLTGGNSASNDYTQTSLLRLRATSINPNSTNHNSVNAAVAEIRFNHQNLAGNASGGNLTFYTNPGNNIAGALTERMRIDSSGKVGIGTTNPGTYQLAVNSGTAGVSDALAGIYVNSQRSGVVYNLVSNNTGNAANRGSGIQFRHAGFLSGAIIHRTDGTAASGDAPGYMTFHTSNDGAEDLAERMRIDSSGNVSIGGNVLVGAGNGNEPVIQSTNSGRLPGSPGFTFRDDFDTGMYQPISTPNTVAFSTAATERMRIDSSGRVLVGKTAVDNTTVGFRFDGSSGFSSFVRDGGEPLYLNRKTSDGDILKFAKDGTAVGSIGSTVGKLKVSSVNTGLIFADAFDEIYPLTDGVTTLGDPGARFDDIYATNGTIQTSDRNEKQDIAELSDAEQRVAVAAKGLLRKFRWKDSVAEKGDEARTHFGIIAQDLQAAFAAEGLDAGDYAMFISSTWTDEETNEEKTRMGVRYSELLAFIIAAI